ncbi:MAG: filamentous hemagglutinin N-terminal domain-containing protein [Pseudomonadales bacterium]
MKTSSWLMCVGVATLALASHFSLAQVILDDTLGGVAGPVSGNASADYFIEESAGVRQATNLFFSFDEFNIGAGERALFAQASTPVQNIIARVTGGSSTIMGTLSSVSAGADFWFINPFGVTIGEGAVIDVAGSFYVSTASSITFSDGITLTSDSSSAILSVAEPESFGFINAGSAAIAISGAELSLGDEAVFHASSNQLFMSELQLSDLQVELLGVNQGASVDLQGLIASSFDQSEVFVNDVLLSSSSSAARPVSIAAGNLDIREFVLLFSSENTVMHPAIEFRGDSITITDNSLFSLRANAENAMGAHFLAASSNELIFSNQSQILNGARGAGAIGGDTSLRANTINLSDGRISGSVFGDNVTSGEISLIAQQDITLEQNSALVIDTGSTAIGERILLEAPSIQVDGSTIAADAFGTNMGAALQLAADTLLVRNDARLTAENSQGESGGIVIRANEIELSTSAAISSRTFGAGVAGNIEIFSNSLSMGSRASIDASTNAIGAAGVINILSLSGESSELLMASDSGISTSTTGRGGAGNINIDFSSVVVGDDDATSLALISSTASLPEFNFDDLQFDELGGSGSIEINADTLSVNSGGSILTDSASDNLSSTLGNIRLSVQRRLVVNSGSISASASGALGGGDVTLGLQSNTIDLLLLSDESTLLARAERGNGGNIFIFADQFLRDVGSLLSADSNLGNAGTVQITAPELDLSAAFLDLDVALLNASQLLAQNCGKVLPQESSSFIVSGSGGLRASPGDYLASSFNHSEYSSALEQTRSQALKANILDVQLLSSTYLGGCSLAL